MNQTNYIGNFLIAKWGFLIVALLGLAGCQNNDFDNRENTNTTTVQVAFSSSESTIATRSTQSSYYENRVENLYLLLFDKNTGEKLEGYFYDAELLYGVGAGEINFNKGVFQLRIPRGRNIVVYGIANIENEIVAITRDDLEYINSLSELENFTIQLNQQIIFRGSSFVMSGAIEDNYGNIRILNSRSLESNERLKLNLKRIDAKVFFHIDAIDGAQFTPKYWMVQQANTSTNLVKTGQPIHSRSFDAGAYPFEMEGKGFSFYALENIQYPKRVISDYDANGFNKREEQEKIGINGSSKPGQYYVNGDFVYAPKEATYVVFGGELRYKDDNNRETIADVTYTVHLGYKNADINDYSLERNTEYHYYIRLKSAKSIEIEVTTGIETAPGTEGHVIKGEQIIQVDAHYDVKQLTFHYRDINNLTWYVNTPFASGFRADFINKNGDSNWILFQLNTKEYSYLRNYYYYYNGLEAFPGIQRMHSANATFSELANDKAGKLMTINQLIDFLNTAKRYDRPASNGTAYDHNYFDYNSVIKVTAYINENYYYEDPITKRKSQDLWKKFVNQRDRELTILNNTSYSPDGASSVTSALVSIRQHSIQTMYNRNNQFVQTAWGSEQVQETELLPYSLKAAYIDYSNRYRDTDYNSPSNGRKNMIKIMANANPYYWSSVINSNNNTLNRDYNAVRFACMLRNRDENGDGRIDNTEIKWYLASINQLTDLWIGENSIESRAKLYNSANKEQDEWYVSSTVNGAYQGNKVIFSGYEFWDNPWAIWAKEGSSVGLMSNLPLIKGNRTYNYRCVRNLGIADNASLEFEPEDFIQINQNQITLPYLDKQSIRSYTQRAELPLHHERDADNMPWWSFEVASTSSLGPNNKQLNWPELTDLINRGQSPCPQGYRVPNQRELAIMKSRINKRGTDIYSLWNLNNHFSRTSYSMNPAGGSRYGFSVNKNGDIMYLINTSNDRGGVRCVRDLSSISY